MNLWIPESPLILSIWYFSRLHQPIYNYVKRPFEHIDEPDCISTDSDSVYKMLCMVKTKINHNSDKMLAIFGLFLLVSFEQKFVIS